VISAGLGVSGPPPLIQCLVTGEAAFRPVSPRVPKVDNSSAADAGGLVLDIVALSRLRWRLRILTAHRH